MEQQVYHLKALNRDILADIIVRTDGSTLAAVACVSSDLHDVAPDQSLWRQLCHSTWPSTALEEAQHVISSSPIGGFDNFYANSYPLLLHGKHVKGTKLKPFKCPELETHVPPSEFASLVDLYYRKECVLSEVLDGIHEAVDVSYHKDSEYNCSKECVLSEVLDGIHEAVDVSYHKDSEYNWNVNSYDCWRWYSNCPFKLELLSLDSEEFTGFGDELGHGHDAKNEETRGFSSISVAEDGKLRHDHSKELVENLRISWVLLDKTNGKSVNLSSWKPLLVQRTWPFHGDYLIHFGSIVPVEESLLPHKLSKCIIIVRCKMIESEGCPKWMEISLKIEDFTGASVSGSKGLMVLNHALNCLQSTNHLEVEQCFRQYEKQKREVMRKKQFSDTLIDSFYVTIEVAVFVIL